MAEVVSTATYTGNIQIVKTIDSSGVTLNDGLITCLDATSQSLTPNTTVKASKATQFQKALSGGTGTIDLTALPTVNAGTVLDGTGLTVTMYKFQNPATNANSIIVKFGASNAYTLGGSAAWTMTLQPGQEFMGFGNGANTVISASIKNIDISGTGSQVLNVTIAVG